MISLEPRFEKKELALADKSVYLDRYTGEWFVVPEGCEPLLLRLREGLGEAELRDLSANELRLISRLAADGLLGETRETPASTGQLSQRNKVTLVIIEASSFCNLSCTYCFEDVPTKGKKMTFETADAIVESLQKLNLADSFVVEFNGGESFINFGTMQRIVDRVEASALRERHSVSYGVTTNLTLLNQEIIEFLRANKFSVSVSLDGVQEDHDRHRIFASGAGSHARVLHNLEILTTGGVEVNTVSVISHPGQLTRAYQFLKKRRIPYASFAIRRHSERMPLDKVDYEEIATELVDAFIDSYRCFKAQRFAPKVMDAVIMIRNLIAPYDPQYMCLRTPCGAGTNMITYDTAGDVYACQDLIKESAFKICAAADGNPQALIDANDLVKRLRARKPGDNRGCEECDFQMFCQGGCYSTSYFAAKKQVDASFSTRTPHCEFYYASFTQLLALLAREGTFIPDYLQSTPYLFS